MYLPPRPDLDTSLDPELPGSFQTHDPDSPSPSAPSSSAPSASRYRSAAQAQRTKGLGLGLGSRGGYQERYQQRFQQRGVARNTRLTRDDLREFADMTLEALEGGAYFPPHAEEPFDLRAKIAWTEERTAYYSPDDREIAGWATADLGEGFGDGDVDGDVEGGKAKAEERRETKIVMREISTLAGARELHKMLEAHPEVQNRTIGVLNFASAKKPGGGFMNGAQAQEESIARSSTLYPSLITPTATQFYAHYAQDPDNPYYTHAMVYSPAVTLFRNDKGHFKAPVDVDVLTSAAVNAGEVRQKIMWEEDMRVLRARVRAAEELRERQVQERRERERRERERREREKRERARAERMKRFAEKDRVKAEAKRKEEEEERKKAGEGAKVHNLDDMEVDEENKGKDVEMKEPDASKSEEVQTVEVEKNTREQEARQDGSSAWTSILLDDSPLVKGPLNQDTSNPWTTVASQNKPSPPNPADIPLPTTPPIPDLPRMPSPPLSAPSPPPPPLPTLLALADASIHTQMHERIARLLYLFHTRGAAHLVLGAYGTGVFQNDVAAVAGIFYDLLVAPGGKFVGVFESVVFAILGGETMRDFRRVFGDGGVDGEEGGAGEESDEFEDVLDGKADDGKEVDDGQAYNAEEKKHDEAHTREETKKDAKETKKLVKKPQPSGSRQSTLLGWVNSADKKAGPSTKTPGQSTLLDWVTGGEKKAGLSTKMPGKGTDKPEPEAADLAKAKAKVEPEPKTSESDSSIEISTTSLPEKAKVEKKVYPRAAKATTARKAKVDPEPHTEVSTDRPTAGPSATNSPPSTKEDKKHFPPAAPI